MSASLFPTETNPDQGASTPPTQPAKKQASSSDAPPKLREMLHVSDVMLILGVSQHSARATLNDIAGPRAARPYKGASTGVTVQRFCNYLELDAASVRASLPRRPMTIKEAEAFLTRKD